MINHLNQHATPTDPPSTAVVMIPEAEADKAVIAELVDGVGAARAPERAQKIAGMSARILVGTLAAELGVSNAADPAQLSDAVKNSRLIYELQNLTGKPADSLLRSAFHVRFFHW